MAGRFFLPAVFLRGGKVLMKKREWKGKEDIIKTKDSVKKTPTGTKNKALQSAFIRETARKAGQNRKVFSMKHPRMHKKIWKILPHTYPSMRSER